MEKEGPKERFDYLTDFANMIHEAYWRQGVGNIQQFLFAYGMVLERFLTLPT